MAAGLAWASSGGSRFRQDHPWWQQDKVGSGLVEVGLATSSPTVGLLSCLLLLLPFLLVLVLSVHPVVLFIGLAVLLVGPGVQLDVL